MQFDTTPCPLGPKTVVFIAKADKPETLCPDMRLVAENENYLIFQPK